MFIYTSKVQVYALTCFASCKMMVEFKEKLLENKAGNVADPCLV